MAAADRRDESDSDDDGSVGDNNMIDSLPSY